jgi:hypothetical protein
LVSVIESYGGVLGHEQLLLTEDEDYTNLSKKEQGLSSNIKAAQKRNKEKFLSFCLIAKADPVRYGVLQRELENDFTKGDNNNPESLTKALHLLANYKTERKAHNNNRMKDHRLNHFIQK